MTSTLPFQTPVQASHLQHTPLSTRRPAVVHWAPGEDPAYKFALVIRYMLILPLLVALVGWILWDYITTWLANQRISEEYDRQMRWTGSRFQRSWNAGTRREILWQYEEDAAIVKGLRPPKRVVATPGQDSDRTTWEKMVDQWEKNNGRARNEVEDELPLTELQPGVHYPQRTMFSGGRWIKV